MTEDPDGLSGTFERDELVRALQSRERFLTGVIGSLGSFVTLDEDWRLTYANAATGTMTGLEVDDLLGTDVRELTPPSLLRQSFPSLETAMRERRSVEFDASHDEEGGVFRVRATPLSDGGLAVYIHDVTESVGAERALRRSEKQYRSIVETAAEGIVLGTPDGRFTFVNQRMADMLGYAPEELIGRSGVDFTYEGWQPAVFEARSELGSGEVVSGEWKARRKDGSLLWTRYNASPILDQQGKHVANLAMHTDVTEAKQAESALRDSEERLNLALAVGGIATWDFRLDTGEVVWNREHYLMLGYTPEEVAPSYEMFLARVHPDDAETVDQAFRRALDEASDYRADFRILRQGGEVRTISAVGHVEVDAGGRALRQYGVMLDVTERAEAERVLRRAEAEKAAQAERSRLARDLHDSVTQALFAASLRAEALAETPDLVTPAALETVESVRRLSRGALAQMRTMLLELRGDRIADVPLPQLLRNLAEAAESRTATDVRLRIDGDPDVPPRVHEAVYRITQEALNNVTRHAHAAEAWVELTPRQSSVRLLVGDDGDGFDASSLDPSHIGLASMRERADEIGAHLTVSSRPGHGTTVELRWEPAA